MLYALSIYAGENTVGIKGGISLTHYSFDWGLRTSGSATIFGEKTLNKYLYHGLQISYYRTGGNAPWSNDYWGILLNYIGFGYNFIVKYPQNQFTPYLSAGVSFDYLVNNENSSSFPISDKINIRPLVSIGTENDFNKFKLILEYVISYNLLPYNTTKPFPYTPLKFTTTLHLFNVGVKFKI